MIEPNFFSAICVGGALTPTKIIMHWTLEAECCDKTKTMFAFDYIYNKSMKPFQTQQIAIV